MSNPASVAQSRMQLILNQSKKLGITHEMLMRRYVFDRFLAKVAASKYRDSFVLKGAMALNAYFENIHRPTRDIDFLGLDRTINKNALDIIKEIVAVDLGEDDGVIFLPETFVTEKIHEKQEDGGVRILGTATIARARVPLKIEVSFGHILTPDAELYLLPTVLPGTSQTRILMYSRETILAEKFETVVSRGISNKRLKDFYDIRVLMKTQDLSGEIVGLAFKNTFGARGTEIPREIPAAYTESFIQINGTREWPNFLKRSELKEKIPFTDVINEIQPFTMRFAHMALNLQEIEDWDHEAGFIEPRTPFSPK